MGHFDVEKLHTKLTDKKYMVSRATIYNTIELLLKSKLIIKHQFGNNSSQFERSYKYSQHDHVLCLDTGELLEFCDPRIHEIQESIAKIYKHGNNASFATFMEDARQQIRNNKIDDAHMDCSCKKGMTIILR